MVGSEATGGRAAGSRWWWGRVLLVGGVVAVAIQFVPMDTTNPPVEQDLAAPAPVAAVLHRACYDCHSRETAWPWYARVAPVSWLVVRDVTEGRAALDFSAWNRYGPAQRGELLADAWEELSEGEMPPDSYLAMHSEARLAPADRSLLQGWLLTQARSVGVEPGAGRGEAAAQGESEAGF